MCVPSTVRAVSLSIHILSAIACSPPLCFFNEPHGCIHKVRQIHYWKHLFSLLRISSCASQTWPQWEGKCMQAHFTSSLPFSSFFCFVLFCFAVFLIYFLHEEKEEAITACIIRHREKKKKKALNSKVNLKHESRQLLRHFTCLCGYQGNPISNEHWGMAEILSRTSLRLSSSNKNLLWTRPQPVVYGLIKSNLIKSGILALQRVWKIFYWAAE